jgi:UDP-glucose 4-epimerase
VLALGTARPRKHHAALAGDPARFPIKQMLLAYPHAVELRRIVVTGSSGHLGEALVRSIRSSGREAVGLDLRASPFTSLVGSTTDRELVQELLRGADAVIHTAALQQPHLTSHPRRAFVDTNVSGTLVMLEAAREADVRSFVFTSSTSAFGRALSANSSQAATWIAEDVVPVPRNVYGVTKIAAEQLCELASFELDLAVVVLRVARFFPELDDNESVRAEYSNENAKTNEFLYRRVDIADAVDAHLLAAEAAPALGFERLIISATTPFDRGDVVALAHDAPAVVRRAFPDQEGEYQRREWKMFPTLDRVYDNARARQVLGWNPRYNFRHVLDQLKADDEPGSPLARLVGTKGYHAGGGAG